MEYIILDLETTGLNPVTSDIIEIGAILVSEDKIVTKFSELVDPGTNIPAEITRLTGITNKMVKGKLSPEEAISKLKKFIGDLPVVAYNAYGFDIHFLNKYRLKPKNIYDLVDLTFFILPTLEHYSAQYLAQYFNLGKEKHRALDDCEIEYKILKSLLDNFKKKPKKLKSHLKHISNSHNWWWDSFLDAESASFNSFIDIMPAHQRYRKDTAEQEAFDISNQKLTEEEVDSYFLLNGNKNSEYAEDRPDQRKMSWDISRSFNEEKHAAIEAGTGIGKSKGYLVPGTLFALKNSIPVVISTYTKVLQDQLFTKEIPHIRTIIKKDLQVALIKGKTNYACLTKADEIYHETADRKLDLHKGYSITREGVKYDRNYSFLLLSSWILQTERGDFDEVPFWLQNRIPKSIEEDLLNHDETCAKGICEGFDANKCFLAKAKLRAKDADIVIINHAVLLTGIIKKELPNEAGENPEEKKFQYSHSTLSNESKYLVIDEAHFLEDAATSSWDAGVTSGNLAFAMKLIYGRRGVAKNLDHLMANCPINQKELEQHFDKFLSLENSIREREYIFKDPELTHFVGYDRGRYPISKIVDDDVRDNYEWDIISKNLSEIALSLNTASSSLRKIVKILKDNEGDEKQLNKILKRAEIVSRLSESIMIFLKKDDFYVRYLELFNGELKFLAAPISVATLLKECLYDNFRSVCLVSATLKVGENFNFLAERCGLNLIENDKIDYISYDSTFDFPAKMKFMIPRGISYRSEKSNFITLIKPFILSAILASKGGSLILCSSYAQVTEIADYLEDPLLKAGINLFRQDRDRSVNSAVRGFRDDKDSVLIGTTSLWHGVDVPGPSLRSLFIIKLPYKSPSNPIFFARCEDLEKKGKKSFFSLSQPLACIDLRQGIGRLIRKKTDQGSVILLDDRLLYSPLLCSAVPKGVTLQKLEQEEILNFLNCGKY